MKFSILIPVLFATLTVVACDRPAVVTVPAAAVVTTPGPAGPQGEPGKPGAGTTVIVVPAASAPSN